MIPLYDNVPRVHPPIAVVAVIACNVLAYLYQLSLPEYDLMVLLFEWGVVPARFTDPAWAAQVGYTGSAVPSFLTYMFLHADFLHILLNMWMLWIFADNIEDVTGHGGFVVFYLLCGLVAVCIHLLFNLDSAVPIIGASGAIAGVMGAYFVLYPHGRVATLVFIIVLRLPAVFFLGFWFVVQIISGLGEGGGAQQSAGVAWWAHVGGFLAGMYFIRHFVKKDRCYYCYNPEKKHYDLND
ncbi:MAG: rhomboid family intramembrane serine protease [Desulfovibrionaceae bacterium]